MKTSEFDHFQLDSEVHTIIYSLREFKAIASLASYLDTRLVANFGSEGMPIVFSCDKDSIAAKFVIATLSDQRRLSSSFSNNKNLQTVPKTLPQPKRKTPEKAKSRRNGQEQEMVDVQYDEPLQATENEPLFFQDDMGPEQGNTIGWDGDLESNHGHASPPRAPSCTSDEILQDHPAPAEIGPTQQPNRPKGLFDD